jgi:NAD(P)-dependent dehydrogenase (short-subunit alcohol dehydrogenase family)
MIKQLFFIFYAVISITSSRIGKSFDVTTYTQYKEKMMNKTTLITGTSSGFGYKMAIDLTANGHTVYASMRDPLGKNKQAASELEQHGANVVEMDVTNQESVDKALSHIDQQSGRLDVLVNNAGIASAGVTEAFTDKQVLSLFDVNVIGVHRVTNAALPIFRRQNDGLIINIGSILGRVTFPFFGIYGASKFAVEALTDSLRHEVSQLGVDVALVQPSAFPTDMYSNAQQPLKSNITEDYGDIGNIPAKLFDHFMSVFQSENAPDPQAVSTTVANLIETPKGKRAVRTIVGADFGAQALNDATAPVQQETIEALGLGDLATV